MYFYYLSSLEIDVGSEGAKAIAEILETNTTLTTLNLNRKHKHNHFFPHSFYLFWFFNPQAIK